MDDLTDEMEVPLKAKNNVDSRIDSGKIARLKALGITVPKKVKNFISTPIIVNNIEVNVNKKKLASWQPQQSDQRSIQLMVAIGEKAANHMHR